MLQPCSVKSDTVTPSLYFIFNVLGVIILLITVQSFNKFSLQLFFQWNQLQYNGANCLLQSAHYIPGNYLSEQLRFLYVKCER